MTSRLETWLVMMGTDEESTTWSSTERKISSGWVILGRSAISGFHWREVPFSAWIFRIAHNCIATHYRKNAQRGGVTAELSEDMVDGRPDLALAVEERITMDEVRRASALLPDAQREVIALRFAVGLSIADTAKALGKREGNIKALQHKAVAKLQKM